MGGGRAFVQVAKKGARCVCAWIIFVQNEALMEAGHAHVVVQPALRDEKVKETLSGVEMMQLWKGPCPPLYAAGEASVGRG